MKRSARQAAKENAEVQKQYLRNKELNKQALKEKAEADIQLAIKRNNEMGGLRRMTMPSLVFQEKGLLWKKASRLFHEDYVEKLCSLNALSPHWVRGLQYWQPQGKSAETLFRSLCNHLLAKFKMPNFLWSGLTYRETSGLIVRIAGGASLYEEVKSGNMPVPLTRKMCHELMTQTLSDVDFCDAVRQTQVKAVGGSEALFNIWKHRFRNFRDRESEIFWFSVLDWFAKRPMLAQDQISPLCDYIAHRKGPNFSMKGREPLPLLREMQEWHGELARIKAARISKDRKYTRAGFNDFIWEKNLAEIWTCEEILTPIALAEEGKALSHCVYSYDNQIVNRDVSIWSLRINDIRQITIEVRNRERKIVQVRGKHNRKPDHSEMKAIIKWANENRLTLSSWL